MTTEIQRPESISINGITVPLPMFIRSVSSFESQLTPNAALEALSLIPNTDPLLISAFDFYFPDDASQKEKKEHYEKQQLIKQLQDRGCFILLDSGNYEASRAGCNHQWSEEKYVKALSEIPHTCSFSFDNLYPSEDVQENARDVVERVRKTKNDFVLPIVHAPVNQGARDSEKIPYILHEVAKLSQPNMIAVPERELGSGIFERVHMVKRIRNKLNKLGYYQPIHILGTGNPVSTVLLSYAGADSFDGLEWCRTAVDRESGLLFHHQQYDFFRYQTRTMARFETVREAESDDEISLMLKMALHNLDFIHDWMEELRDNLKENRISEMLAFYLPEHVYNEINNNLKDMLG